MKRSTALFLGILVPWGVAWLAITLRGTGALLPHPYLPALPYVAAPFDPKADVVSVVPLLYRALLLGALAALAAEFVKAATMRETSKRGPLYVALLGYQVTLFTDVVRSMAPDWLVYGFHFLGLIRLGPDSFYLSQRIVFGAPWPSFAVGLTIVLWRFSILRKTAPSGKP